MNAQLGLIALLTVSFAVCRRVECPRSIELEKGDDIKFDIDTFDAFYCYWEIRNEKGEEFEIKIERDNVFLLKL